MDHKSDFLGTQKIPPLLLRMSLPAMIGMIVMTLYNIVDSIFIGHIVGPLGLGAVGIVFPFMMLVIALSVGYGIGASSIISRKLGEKKVKFAEKVFENFITAILLASISITILGTVFIDQLIYLLGSSDEIFPYAKTYLFPILLGLTFQILSFSLTNIVRSIGSAKTAMFAMIIGALLNIFLDYIFMYIYGFGISGAAYATVISQLMSTLFLIYYFFSKNSALRFRKFSLDPAILRSTAIIGFPSFIRQGSMSIIGIIVNHLLLFYGGAIAIAGYGIMFRILMLLVMPSMGIMQGSQPIIGYNYGAKLYHRVKETLKLSIAVSTAIILATFIAVYLYPELFIKMFTKDSELISFTLHGLLIMFIGFPLLGFQFISQGYFQAVGKAKQALVLSLLRQVICFLPLLIVLPFFFGLDGIWYVYPVSDFISTAITFLMIRKEFALLGE